MDGNCYVPIRHSVNIFKLLLNIFILNFHYWVYYEEGTHTLNKGMTAWGRFDPHFDSSDDFMPTALATCYLTVPQLFCWIQDRIHLQCDWVLFKVTLVPFLKDASLHYHFRTSCFRKLCLQWNTIALMTRTFWNKQVKDRRDFSFWLEGHKRMKLSNTFAPIRERKCWA